MKKKIILNFFLFVQTNQINQVFYYFQKLLLFQSSPLGPELVLTGNKPQYLPPLVSYIELWEQKL